MNRQLRALAAFPAIFLLAIGRVAYVPPLATPEFQQGANPSTAKVTTAITEALALLPGSARNHPLVWVVPAV